MAPRLAPGGSNGPLADVDVGQERLRAEVLDSERQREGHLSCGLKSRQLSMLRPACRMFALLAALSES